MAAVEPGGQLRRLQAAAQALDVPLAPAQAQQLLDYLAQMQRWNRTYNLTALRDPEQMLVQHVFDSLSVVAPLERELARQGRAAQACVMDVGSGGGLPGVVIAVCKPGWSVCCVDAVEKKTAFVRQMGGALKLPNLSARHSRIEQLDPAACDVVVSRAFASLQDFSRLAGRHVRPGGWLLAMKGRDPVDETAALEQDGQWAVARSEPLHVPELQAQRCLIWMCRKGNP
ncbi:16S rRNA (guanine(527)-N(7))-methyltransferase RsmG [Orrella sp. JC864]|uniref:16S rRNA (guanine(527)-N(7))-methyltransferase RsmG n=1 Tax=Orrella sp. JC864 TaxID=3120298 RepID=UPI003009A4BC